jgi:hypothetical protein
MTTARQNMLLLRNLHITNIKKYEKYQGSKNLMKKKTAEQAKDMMKGLDKFSLLLLHFIKCAEIHMNSKRCSILRLIFQHAN